MIEFCFDPGVSYRIEDAEGTDAGHITGIFRDIKAYAYMTLCPKVIDLIWLYFLENTIQVASVRKIAIVEVRSGTADVWILVEMINTRSVECACASDDTMHLVPLFKEKFCEIGSVLSRDAGDECFFHVYYLITY